MTLILSSSLYFYLIYEEYISLLLIYSGDLLLGDTLIKFFEMLLFLWEWEEFLSFYIELWFGVYVSFISSTFGESSFFVCFGVVSFFFFWFFLGETISTVSSFSWDSTFFYSSGEGDIYCFLPFFFPFFLFFFFVFSTVSIELNNLSCLISINFSSSSFIFCRSEVISAFDFLTASERYKDRPLAYWCFPKLLKCDCSSERICSGTFLSRKCCTMLISS